MQVRRASHGDTGDVVRLVLDDARKRERFDPLLWRVADDAHSRVEISVSRDAAQGGGPFHWFLAEDGETLAGIAHVAIIPCPPVYALSGVAGVLLDETFVTPAAHTMDAMLAAVEAEIEKKGAVIFLAACAEADDAKIQALENRGYRATTSYFARHSLQASSPPSHVRRAAAGDLGGMARLGRMSRDRHREANRVMWHPHPDADARFAYWMKQSLDLADRSIFVTENAATLSGFVVAQPASPLQIALATDPAPIGLIDDFCAMEFAASLDGRIAGGVARDLLLAAEADFVSRAKPSAMAICPTGWTAKASLLRSCGYRIANHWFFRERSGTGG
ncbi:MAG TPA: hypothetical protein VHU87_07110 [Rhizomicrobium sp.]|jgi:xanthosine utilization system XapX-like protein|nr:hypothetical protein [Rhizomicrobium sp.]